MLTQTPHTCPCGSEQVFEACCGKFINNKEYPSTPEQLMRSRYSAYVLKNENYLLNSWHELTRPHSLDLSNDSTQWEKLSIISSTENTVHFVAFFSESVNGKENYFYLSENSEFIKEQNWYYLKGMELKTSELTKNMPCPCQSGKKFKRCCASIF
ncbi:MAG: YchJ family metal-binding protein [Gammaproteobacteria bacterium]|nr:YchJ family metal-binding protein [Gammaproteobacteria bacterium]